MSSCFISIILSWLKPKNDKDKKDFMPTTIFRLVSGQWLVAWVPYVPINIFGLIFILCKENSGRDQLKFNKSCFKAV